VRAWVHVGRALLRGPTAGHGILMTDLMAIRCWPICWPIAGSPLLVLLLPARLLGNTYLSWPLHSRCCLGGRLEPVAVVG
jgi:hypothetical protein